jgi:hypothetical protein
MKNLGILLLGCALLVSPSMAQTENNNISLSEFRQALVDLMGMANTPQGLDLAMQLPTLPDSALAVFYSRIPNPKQFQTAVATMKAKRAGRLGSIGRGGRGLALAAASIPRRAQTNLSPALSLSSPASGIASTQVPDFTPQDPQYPSGSNWQNMAYTLNAVNLIPDGDASMLRCDINNEAGLSIIVSVFNGINDAAQAICNAIGDPGFAGFFFAEEFPAQEICFAAALVVTTFTVATGGYYADCGAQDKFIDGAETGAAYANINAAYTLEFRLMVEENLLSTTTPMGMFVLPASQNGYLENVRAIVNDTIVNMQYVGQLVSTANNSLLAGDNFFNAGSYKLAYKQYQNAYALAVK